MKISDFSKIRKYTVAIALLIITSSCGQAQEKSAAQEAVENAPPVEVPTENGLERAYFASGCFWCVEAIFESVKGVKEVYSGYSGGSQKNPNYEEVSYGRTSHAEAVEVYYDPDVISFTQLVQVFFGSHDPTTLNRQGPDRGAQYRSIAFYKNNKEQKIIQDYINKLKSENIYGDRTIVTEVKPFEKFYMAEEYHQDYEKRNPNNSYIRNVSIPRLNRFKENFESYLKEDAH